MFTSGQTIVMGMLSGLSKFQVGLIVMIVKCLVYSILL